MSDPGDVWAVIPVKETAGAKQRLAALLSAKLRQALALAMLEDVLEAVAGVNGLGGAMLVTVDPQAIALARRYGAHAIADGAHDGHTGAVNAGLLSGLLLCWLTAVIMLALANRPVHNALSEMRWKTGAPIDPRAGWKRRPICRAARISASSRSPRPVGNT